MPHTSRIQDTVNLNGKRSKSLGFIDPDAYYFKKTGWPIGKTGGVGKDAGGNLIASKRKVTRYA